jgi:prepilin-type N-terminal cleavage/methylation domain-containing protein
VRALKLKNNRGITLTEMLVAIAIMCMIATPISFILLQGYRNFSEDNGTMTAQGAARSAIDGILNDLRKNDNKSVSVSTEQSAGGTIEILHINDSLQYTYSTIDKKLLKNGTSIFQEDEGVELVDFYIKEVRPEDRAVEGYDSSLIDIRVSVKVRLGQAVTLEDSYRRKITE